jgi:N6-adenosine-specific RNA methylase IME4
MTELKIKEEFRDQLPPLEERAYKKLEKDICEKGCFDPIRTWRGYIIDGHNRYRICQEHGVEFRTISLDECLEDEIDVRIWIIDHQDGRRSLEPYQRCEMQMVKEHLIEGKQNNQYTIQQDESGTVRRRTEADKPSRKLAEAAGVGKTTYFQGKYVAQHAPEEVKEKLRNGKEAIKTAYNKLKQEERKQERQETLKATEFPQGKYRVIYADPPWSYNDKRSSGGMGGAEEQYPTMSLEDICDLPVKDIADKEAVLFLWATTPLLREAFQVMGCWGFEYKTLFVWDKVRPFPGNYSSVAQEVLLLGTKGSCTPDCRERPYSIIRVEKGRHSEKPEEFRKLIHQLYKYGNRVELFARRQTEGWDVYGNECA